MAKHLMRQFDEGLTDLRKQILEMGSKVEKMIEQSVRALVERDSDLAKKMIGFDHEVNAMEVAIDEKCIRMLARFQPEAKDLRFITTGLKIVTDLERISDLGVNICERAISLNREEPLKEYDTIPRMADEAKKMIHESLEAFVKEDTALAIKVCQDDDVVDDLHTKVLKELIEIMAGDPNKVERALSLIFVSKHLERIADHATNISEIVVYMVKGKIIRHMENPEVNDS